MDISSCQYQIMADHQLDEMFLAPKSTTSTITTANDHHQTNTQEPKKGGGLGVASGAAKPQPPGPPLSCPRCDSTNTKFCYYNNYSLSQPRYFCKACRRYWTQGGSLRNVPVGGGCRKNTKRSSSSSSSSSSASKANNKALEQSLPQTLIPTANPSSAINPLLLSLDPSFLLPPNPNPNHNFLDLLRGANNGRFNFGVSGYGAGGVDGGAAEQGQPWQFGNSGRNVSVAVENGNVRDYGYSYWNDVNGAAGAYWNGVVNSSLM